MGLADSETGALLEMRGIRKAFPGVVALDGVDFDLRTGEVHVLLGENGAGKSTLMKILSGAYPKDSGEIFLDGQSVEISGPRHAQRLGVGIIYQEFNLVPQMTVAENIFLGNEPSRRGFLDRRKSRVESARLLAELGVELDPGRRVGDLSIALQQMVEVAKALSLRARVLIMDEPTSALTESEIVRLFAAIRRLQRRGVGIVYISHRLQELSEIGDRITVLRDGKKIATLPTGQVPTSELVRLMADRDFTEHYPKRPAPMGEEALRVEGLSRRGSLEGVSFSLRRGEILGLAGLMGSGRTDLARALFGAVGIDSGSIWIRGRPVAIPSPAAAIRHGLGFLTEDRKSEGLVLGLSLRDNVSLPSADRLSRWGVMDGRAEEALAERFIAELRIKTTGTRQKVVDLSGGNQQKVVLGKWLARESDVLIFDEPTRGIDVAAKVEIYETMNRLVAAGAAIIMISSELPEILGMSDRILVMRQGRVAAVFQRSEADQRSVLAAALGHRAEGPA